MSALKVKLKFEVMQLLQAELKPSQMWAFYVLGLGEDLPVSVTKYDLAGIILHLCKKLDWIEESEIHPVEKHNIPDRQTVQKKTIVREQEIIEVEGNYIHPKIEVLKRELEDGMDQPRLETNSLVNINENCNFESESAISQQKVIPEGAQNEDIEVMDMKLETESQEIPEYGGPGTRRQVCQMRKYLRPIDRYEEVSVPANKDTRRTSKGADAVDDDWTPKKLANIAPKQASPNNTSHQSSRPEFPTAALVDWNYDFTDLCMELQETTSRPAKRSLDKISVAVRVTPPPLTANLTPETLVDRKKKPIFRHKAQDLDEAMNNPHVKPRLSYGYMITMALLVNIGNIQNSTRLAH